jgi:hypothetical protein
MRLIPAATAASIAVWCSRTYSGSSLIGMSSSVSMSALAGEILFLYRRWPRPRVGTKVPATLPAWVM